MIVGVFTIMQLEGLNFFETNIRIEVEKITLIREDIDKYNLLPNRTKKTDPRSSKFVKANGDIAVELDALPIQVLKDLITRSIDGCIDHKSFLEVKEEAEEGKFLSNWIEELKNA